MGKVKGDEKIPNEKIPNKKRRKREKELDILRRNVLEAKRKLDNKTQGFDNKGKRSGVKKMCNRLLPPRKPQNGIFANGSKGAEIKRGNSSLNEAERARFEGDLQKVLGDGKCESKESTSDALNKILHRRSAKTTNIDEQLFVRIPNEKLEHNTAENITTEIHSGKRKLQVSVDLDGKMTKNHHSEIENMKVIVEYTEVKSGWNNIEHKKCRSLFQDVGDDFGPIDEPIGVNQLRFSPRIGKTKIMVNPSTPKLSTDTTHGKGDTDKINFNSGQFAKMAAASYERLCTMVCAENFDTCLQEIPHINPLQKVKQSLFNVYTETCNRKALRRKVKAEMLPAEKSLSANSHFSHSHLHENEHFDDDAYHGRLISNTAFVSPPRGVCPGLANLKNFLHWEASRTSSAGSNPITIEVSDFKNRNKNIRRIIPEISPEIGITEWNTNPMDVNYNSSRTSLRSDIMEFLKIDEEPETSVRNASSPRLAAIPSDRQKIMLRYLKEMKSSEQLKEFGSINAPELSAASKESDYVKQFEFDDPARRREKRAKLAQNHSYENSEGMLGPSPCGATDAKQAPNLFNVKCDDVRKCLGVGLKDIQKIEDRGRPAVINLRSASRSTIARIPSDRGKLMQRYLEDINNQRPRREDNWKTIATKGFAVPEVDNKLQKRHQLKNTFVDRSKRNERHMPAILRKSRVTMKNNKSNAIGAGLARGALEFNNLNSNMPNLASEKVAIYNFFDKRQTSKNPLSIDSPFTITTNNPTNRLEMIENAFHNANLSNRTPQLETPTIVNALYNLNKKNVDVERDFAIDGFDYELSIGETDASSRSEVIISPIKSKLQSSANHSRQNSIDNAETVNFRSVRQSKNLQTLSRQRRSDRRANRTLSDERRMIFSEDKESHRFPVFLKRSHDRSTENRARFDRTEPEGWPLPEIGEPKVIIIKDPTVRKIGDDVRREMNVQSIPYKIECQTQNRNYEVEFPKFPRRLQQESIDPFQLQNGRQNALRLRITDGAFQNVDQRQQSDKLRVRRCGCEIDVQNSQHAQVGRIMMQRKVTGHKNAREQLRHNSMSLFEPTTFDIPTSQKIFQHDPSSDLDVTATCGSWYCSNVDFAPMDTVQFSNGQTALVLPKSKQESYRQSSINLTKNSNRILHCQNCSPVLSIDKNQNYKYIIDPRCPQDGYQWNQIDQSGAQVHQRVIQPVYNAVDAYRPQLPHKSFFTTDT